ncbi:DNA recombination protein RmuC [Geminicoccaceae bacterium 1502E]|nr:DNA recombination protein RmuC [Geminicoccaceae bacterium 1502E]
MDGLLLPALLALNTLLLLVVLLRPRGGGERELEGRLALIESQVARTQELLGQELARSRGEAGEQARLLREEMQGHLQGFGRALEARVGELRERQEHRFDAFQSVIRGVETDLRGQNTLFREKVEARLGQVSEQLDLQLRRVRGDTETRLRQIQESLHARLGELGQQQQDSLKSFAGSMDEQMAGLRRENQAKLDQMRQTVDEKLQTTLEARLGESFKLVSERLERVHAGLGEMQGLAAGVGDLKRVLTNVKSRGTFGELQLRMLIEDFLTPEQYAENAPLGREGTQERVEFAIRMPGKDEQEVFLPVDSKFPQEDYERLLSARDAGDGEAAEKAGRELERTLRTAARAIAERYINPPQTTDFAILFVPTEGLYAELQRRPGLTESLQREHRVIAAGPMNFQAILSSLRMGFRTVAIERRSAEVREVLGAVKTEFGRFGEALSKVRRRLEGGIKDIEHVEVRSRAMGRRLKRVEELPEAAARTLLDTPALPAREDEEEDEAALA